MRKSLMMVAGLALGAASIAQPEGRRPLSSHPAILKAPTNLRCEYLKDPIGIDVDQPRLSWQLHSDRRGTVQTAYRILVASRPQLLKPGSADLWDSGKVVSGDAVHVKYTGGALASFAQCFWKVRAWDNHDAPSPFSKTATWETGALRGEFNSDAKMIGRREEQPWRESEWIWFPEGSGTDAPSGTRYFRAAFEAAGRPTRATLQITADNAFDAWLNGRRVGGYSGENEVWNVMRFYDVTAEVAGANALAIEARNDHGAAGLIFALRLEFADGHTTIVRSNTAVRCTREMPEGWQATAFDASKWSPAKAIGKYGIAPWGDPMVYVAPATLLRSRFQVETSVRRARLYCTALGSYRVSINGKRVGSNVLTPDWTDYRKRALYQSYDVTEHLRKGDNAIGALLGDGWYGSALGWGLQRYNFGPPPPRLWTHLRIELANGSVQIVGADRTWRTSPSAVLRSEIYGGEVYDARLEQSGWDTPGFNDTEWQAAEEFTEGVPPLHAQRSPAIAVTRTIRPKSVTRPAKGVYVFDMGQNMVGWARLTVRGKKGDQVTLRFAERVEPDGNVYRTNLRRAEATDRYTLKGGLAEVFEPSFTYHGFRYVEVTGYPGTPTLDSILGCVVHTDAEEGLTFKSSDKLVNKLQQNILWGQRGNFHSVPTDCPQRDERLGWMGDANVFALTSCFNADLASFYAKWMRDVTDAQSAEGGFSDVAPRVIDLSDGAPAWGDAGIVIPYITYLMYSDTGIILENWDAMAKWMGYIHKANPDKLWLNRRNNDFGDWVSADSKTPNDILATAVWAYDAMAMAQMAQAIGRADAAEYERLHADIAKAFTSRFVSDDGKIEGGTQTAYVLALHAKLLPERLRPLAAQHLAKDIEGRGYHLSTGFIGTAYLMPTLTEHGMNDIAYRLLLNTDYPSWGYTIKHGATTIWERWDGWRHDKGYQDAGMNSFNHYAFGAVGEWLYRYLAGLAPDPNAPGFKRLIVRPRPGGTITSAGVEYRSIRGKAAVAWKFKPSKRFKLDVTVPCNASAIVYVPAESPDRVTESGMQAGKAVGVTFLRMEDGCAVFDVASGEYRFEASPD